MKNTIFYFLLIFNFAFISSCIESYDYPDTPFYSEPSADYQSAIEHAKKSGKPIMIYFSGKGVVNARKLEDNTFNNPWIQHFCHNEIEVITLLVDDRTKLEQPIEIESAAKKIRLKNIGQKNAYFQKQHFGKIEQPQLVFIDNEGKELISYFYQNINTLYHVKDFLKEGKRLFNKQKYRN